MAKNTSYSRRADRAYGGCPSACRPLLQGFSAEVATGCFPVFLSCVLFSTLRPVRQTRFTVHRPVYFSEWSSFPHPSRVRVRSAPRAGPRKGNFRHSVYWGSIYGGIGALARGYSHGVTLFQNFDGLLDSFTFFVSQSYRLTVELVRQGQLKVSGPWARTWSAGSKSAFATVVGTSNVKQRLTRICAKSFAARSTTQKGVLIAYPGKGSSWLSVPLLVLYSPTVCPGLVALL